MTRKVSDRYLCGSRRRNVSSWCNNIRFDTALVPAGAAATESCQTLRITGDLLAPHRVIRIHVGPGLPMREGSKSTTRSNTPTRTHAERILRCGRGSKRQPIDEARFTVSWLKSRPFITGGNDDQHVLMIVHELITLKRVEEIFRVRQGTPAVIMYS